MKRFICFFSIAMFFISPSLAEDLYVKSKYAKMRKGTRGKNKKKTIVKIKRGKKVQKMDKKKKWYKISYKGKIGWVYKKKLKKSKPKTDPSLTAKDGSDLLAAEVDAGSAVRGLKPTTTKLSSHKKSTAMHRKYTEYHRSYITVIAGKEDTDKNLTEAGIEIVELNDDDLDSFLEEGGLGEYYEQ